MTPYSIRDAGEADLEALREIYNAASLELHRRLGFEDTGVLREASYKFGRWLDLAFMTRKL